MKKDFYNQRFDDSTKLKLEIFKGYVREWLPVFLTQPEEKASKIKQIGIYDFFSGPGKNKQGNPGSPLLIVNEIKQYCSTHKNLKGNSTVRLVFNDIRRDYIERLQKEVAEVACTESCCSIEYTVLPFDQSLSDQLPEMKRPDTANLVIMDQYGVKHVPPTIVEQLSRCSRTDILFFISSSYIKRFIDTPEFRGKYNFPGEEIKNVEFKTIHLFICDFYRKEIKTDYYLAPFSIKKGRNIYGIIFGSGNLLGLEKFLKVAWAIDEVTGTANYNVDNDFSWDRQQLDIFPEYSNIKKIDLFKKELLSYITSNRPDNKLLYEFCLTKGFPPKQANDVLREMQKLNMISVIELPSNQPVRRNAFYLAWKHFKDRSPKVRFDPGAE